MGKHEQHIELLKKLADGSISDYEKWILEKASLDDPFLADALEGYYMLQERNDKQNIPLSKQKLLVLKSRWWKIAAAFIVLIGAALVFDLVILDNVDQQPSIMVMEEEAQTKESLETFASKEPEIIKQEAEPVDRNITVHEVKPQKRKAKSRNLSIPSKQSKDKSDNEDAMTINDTETSKNHDASNAVLMDEIQEVKPLSEWTLKGVVTSDDGVPIRGADLYTQDRTNHSTTDQYGNFLLDLKEDDSLIIAAYTGYDTQVLPAQKNMSFKLRRAAREISEPLKSRKAMMDESSLKAIYKEEIDKRFKSIDLDCFDPGENKVRETIPIEITIDDLGEVSKVDFLRDTTYNCTSELEEKIYSLNGEEIFETGRSLRFIYHFKVR